MIHGTERLEAVSAVPLAAGNGGGIGPAMVRPDARRHADYALAIERRLAAHGDARTVVRIAQGPLKGGSSFAINRLTATLSDGSELPLIYKDLNPLHGYIEARQVRALSLERSRREIWVYESLLADHDIGTPVLFGARWAPGEGELWIVIEDVGPKRLSRMGDFELWCSAARWLGEMQVASFDMGIEEPGTRAHLVDYDDLERVRLAKLRAGVRHLGEEEARVVTHALGLLDEVGRVSDTLPRVLVHGEYFGKNVVVRPEPCVRRLSVIDWETAGVGNCLIDLVSISAGRWTTGQRLEMWRAYASMWAAARGGAQAFPADLPTAAATTTLRQALAWLGWWIEGDDVHIGRWVREVDKAADLVVTVA